MAKARLSAALTRWRGERRASPLRPRIQPCTLLRRVPAGAAEGIAKSKVTGSCNVSRAGLTAARAAVSPNTAASSLAASKGRVACPALQSRLACRHPPVQICVQSAFAAAAHLQRNKRGRIRVAVPLLRVCRCHGSFALRQIINRAIQHHQISRMRRQC